LCPNIKNFVLSLPYETIGRINIQTVDLEVNTQLLLDVFLKYGVVTSYPIDYEEFVKDVISTTISTKTVVYNQVIVPGYYSFNL
jgi:hypothetical protein